MRKPWRAALSAWLRGVGAKGWERAAMLPRYWRCSGADAGLSAHATRLGENATAFPRSHVPGRALELVNERFRLRRICVRAGLVAKEGRGDGDEYGVFRSG